MRAKSSAISRPRSRIRGSRPSCLGAAEQVKHLSGSCLGPRRLLSRSGGAPETAARTDGSVCEGRLIFSPPLYRCPSAVCLATTTKQPGTVLLITIPSFSLPEQKSTGIDQARKMEGLIGLAHLGGGRDEE